MSSKCRHCTPEAHFETTNKKNSIKAILIKWRIENHVMLKVSFKSFLTLGPHAAYLLN